jgi:hypothetical protein
MSVQWASSISTATPGKLGRTYNLLARNTTLETGGRHRFATREGTPEG